MACAAPLVEARRIWGYTRPEWLTWMTPGGWDNRRWSEWCAQRGPDSADAWEEYFQEIGWRNHQWVDYWIDPSNWPE